MGIGLDDIATGVKIAGGVKTIFSGGGSGQHAFERDVLKHQIQYRVKDAKEAGIHPLAALGMSPYQGSPSIDTGIDKGAAISKIGQDIQGYHDRKKSNDIRALEIEALKEDIRHKRIVNDKLLESGQVDQTGVAPDVVTGQGNNVGQRAPGIDRNVQGLYTTYLDRDNRVTFGLAQGASESFEPMEILIQGKYLMDSFLDAFNVSGAATSMRIGKWLGDLTGKRFQFAKDARQRLLDYREKITRGLKLPPGHEWQVDYISGEVKAVKAQNRFFSNKNLNYNNNLTGMIKRR